MFTDLLVLAGSRYRLGPVEEDESISRTLHQSIPSKRTSTRAFGYELAWREGRVRERGTKTQSKTERHTKTERGRGS